MIDSLELHIPKNNDLDYRRYLIADEATMSYNLGYGDGGTGVYRQSQEQVQRWWQSWQERGNYYAYVLRVSDDTFVGEVSIHFPDETFKSEGVGRISVVIQDRYRRQGYGEEALRLLVDLAFVELGLKRLLDDIPPDRKSAIRIFERIGFRRNSSGLMELSRESDDA